MNNLDPVGRPIDPLPVGRAAGLRQLQREQRQRRRKQLKLGFGGAVVALVALVAGVILLGGGGGDDDVPTDARTQRTLLLMVKAADGTAISSALLAHEPKAKQGAVVLVPPQVIATVPGLGAQPFGRAVLRGQAGASNALADLMGVIVDGSWVLDRATFARLVDQVGGIDVDVDVDVVSGNVFVLRPGRQHLDGARAFAYATYLTPAEQEQSRLARLQGVLDGIVQAWPAGSEALLKSLGAGSKLSLAPAVAGSLLSGLKGDNAAQQLQYRSLPVVKLDTGTADQRFRVDADATRALVDDLLSQSIPPGSRASGNRVLVLNGVGTPGLGERVRAKLVPAGFVFVGSRNAPSFGHAKTVIYVKEATPAGQALGARVAKALGVRASVQVSDQIGTLADVVVIVGKDFKGS